MTQFFSDMSSNPLLVSGLVAGALAALACGMIGPYVVTRRIVFLAGAVAHASVGGLGMAIWARTYHPRALSWLEPIHGAAVAAVVSAIVIALAHQRVKERLDTLIGAIWAVGMAGGLLAIKFTPGYHVELMGFLFGNISAVSWGDVYLIAAVNLGLIVMVLLLHKSILAICIDPQHAQLQGVNVLVLHAALLVMVALAVISLVQVVGLILVMALLTLPAATAGHYFKRMAPMMLASLLLCLALTTLPRIAVYGSRISPSEAIVLAAACVYLLSVALGRRWQVRSSA